MRKYIPFTVIALVVLCVDVWSVARPTAARIQPAASVSIRTKAATPTTVPTVNKRPATRTIIKKVVVYRTRIVYRTRTRVVYRTRTVYRTRVVTRTVRVVVHDLPAPKPTPAPLQGYVHVCSFDHFDQTTTTCLSDDTNVVLTAEETTQLVWSAPIGQPQADYINVLKQDGTGKWVVVGTDNLNGSSVYQGNASQPNTAATETISNVFFNSSAYSKTGCDTSFELQVATVTGRVYGTVPLTLTC